MKVRKADRKAVTAGQPDPGTETTEYLRRAGKAKMPESIEPMLATLVDDPFDDPGWLFEVKWDGYRAVAFLNNGDVRITSRNNKSFTEKYYPVTSALQGWKVNAVVDGEIIVINRRGVSEFESLQNWRSEADGSLVYYIFDVLWYNGKDLMKLPLQQRRAILTEIYPGNLENIKLSDVFPENGKDFFKAAGELGLEGMIAKRADSIYQPGARNMNWLKIKVHKRQEVVIGGYTINEGSGNTFSALLLGLYDNGELRFAGKVGTGFSEKLRKELMKEFTPLITKKCPFAEVPDVNEPSRFRPSPPHAEATWLKPKLVCEITFAEVTREGIFRHPSFKGLRDDKKPGEVKMEKTAIPEEVIPEKKNRNHPGKIIKVPAKREKGTILNPNEETQVKKVNGHDIKFTNLSKIYWPEEGFTKRDMINYYYQAAEYILPYLKDRPQSLNRFPNGIHGQSFYQKNVKGKSPDWVRTFPYETSDGEHKEYLIGSDEATLLWMASLGCIEMNPWFSRVQSEDYPDYCIIDLDPDKNTFDQVVTAALEVKKVLESLGITGYPKTSGSTGMHICIPLGAKYTYDQSQMFAKFIVTLVHGRLPEFTSIERMVRNRDGKMYLDHLQNRPEATVASVYSLRPKPGAPVSMPLYWEEVKKGLKMNDFNIKNSISRLRSEGDIFSGVLGKGINIESILEKAQASYT